LNFEYVEAVSIRSLGYPVPDRLILSGDIGHSPTEGWVQLWSSAKNRIAFVAAFIHQSFFARERELE
jgi:hypothetical protein